MRLIDVYERGLSGYGLLWTLLSERAPYESISHKAMPTVDEHIAFVVSRPYAAWYLITDDWGDEVGACYLTDRDEIGIGIFKTYQGHGYAERAIRMLMEKHGERRYLANINPENERSMRLFDHIGFDPLQVTLALDYKFPDIGPQ